MITAKGVGRTIGGLYLVQMAVAPRVNFGLLAPALTAPPGFLGDPSDAGFFHAPAALIRSVRNSAHYMNLLVSGGSIEPPLQVNF